MKIFVAHATASNFREELYAPLRNSQLNTEHDIILPHENGRDIITKEIIKSCDAVVAEVSHPSTGQGIELGWANVLEVPILCIYKKDSKPSGSLKYICDHMIAYTGSEDMIVQLAQVLSTF